MDNTKALQEARARKQYLQSELIKVESEIEKLELTDNETLLQKYDYDCDGIISQIDYRILADAILNRNNSSYYNSQNKTFNGKSLDLNKDNNIDVSDFTGFAHAVLDYLGNSVPIDLVEVSFFDYTKDGFNGTNWIKNYCNSHNGEYPTLDELKAAYNAA